MTPPPTPLPLTYLFVPGNRPERFDKALAVGAGAVIIDLEDAVSAQDKAAARANIAQWAAANPAARATVFVRINDVTTEWFRADLALLRESGIARVMLPKAESAEHIAMVTMALPAHGAVMPIIESARGVQNVAAIAAAPGIHRLAFGTLDYAVDLDLADDERGLVYPSAQIAIASRAAGIPSPVGGVTAAIDDEAQLLADLAFARAFGYGAKLCIHPQQVAVVHRALQPGAAEIDWARRVIAAAAASAGAAQLDGKMVDRPVLLRAQGILDRAAARASGAAPSSSASSGAAPSSSASSGAAPSSSAAAGAASLGPAATDPAPARMFGGETGPGSG